MSRSRTIDRRLKSRAGFRKPAGVLIMVAYGVYLIWRATIFSEEHFWFSSVFFVSELLAYLLMLVTILSCWNYRHREAVELDEVMTVDVFIPVYKEPVEMIRLTVMAAHRLDYPHKIYLLDDGGRDEVKGVAEEFDVEYLRRDGNEGAKAGNMNAALKVATGDAILVLDADHIVQREGVGALVGFFKDEKVGFVVAPQDYYNTDALQYLHHGKGRQWHDQSRFYNVTQACKDFYGGSTSCGTGVMYRREALDVIGGFPELTVTEDMHTSLLMHEAGYESAYFNEPIAYGVSPADIGDYYRTRQRWCHGNLHVLQAEKPWKSKRLSFKQKFFYAELGIIYLECWQQLLMFLVPFVSLLFAWQPFEISIFNVSMVLGFPLLMMVFLDEQGCGMNRNWTGQLFAIARMPVQMLSWSGFFGKKIGWKVSMKNLEGKMQWRLLMPQVVLFLMSVGCLLFGAYQLGHVTSLGPVSEFFRDSYLGAYGMITGEGYVWPERDFGRILGAGYSLDLILISGFWVAYNGLRTGYWIFDTYRRTKLTHDFFRFEIPLVVEEEEGGLKAVKWISQKEICVDWGGEVVPEVGGELVLGLWLPGGLMKVRMEVCEVADGKLTGRFIWDVQRDEDVLSMALYSVDWHSEMNQREGYFETLLERFWRKLTFSKAEELAEWRGGLCGEGDGRRYVAVGRTRDRAMLLGFGEYTDGERICVRYPGGASDELEVGEQLEMQGWCRKLLGGEVRWKAEAHEVGSMK